MERIVVVGASAGGVAALERLVRGLPPGFPAAVLVALHLPVGYKSVLAGILARAGPLPVGDADDHAPLERGWIYVAVPDAHLMVETRRMRVVQGPRENGFRPSVDVLFRSAACAWGARAIDVVLSGALGDGASGLWAIRSIGGIGIVQHPADAAFESMPLEALRRTDVNYTVPADEIGPLLGRIVTEPAPPEPAHAPSLRRELATDLDIAAGASAWQRGIMAGNPSSYTCPACHGVLYEVREGERRRFRCHTGHGYTASALLPELVRYAEDSLWDAARALQEAIALCREAAEVLVQSGQRSAAEALLARAERASEKLETLRALSLQEGGPRRS